MANEGGNDSGDELQMLVQHGDDVVAAVQAAADLRRLLYGIGDAPADWFTVGWDVHDLPDTKRPRAERLEQTFRDRIRALARRHAAVLQLFERVHDAIVLANPEGLRPMFNMPWTSSSAVHVMVRLAGDVLAHHERGEFAALLDNHELTAGCGRLDGLEQLQHRVRLDVARLRRMQPAPPTEPVAEQVEPESTRDRDDLQSKVDRAVALLMRDVRDGGEPRSARDYCRDVGIRHPSTLTRRASWKAAQAGAAQATQRTTERQGSRDAEGNVEAWLLAEPCENCGAHAHLVLRPHRGATVRVCETCAGRLGT